MVISALNFLINRSSVSVLAMAIPFVQIVFFLSPLSIKDLHAFCCSITSCNASLALITRLLAGGSIFCALAQTPSCQCVHVSSVSGGGTEGAPQRVTAASLCLTPCFPLGLSSPRPPSPQRPADRLRAVIRGLNI